MSSRAGYSAAFEIFITVGRVAVDQEGLIALASKGAAVPSTPNSSRANAAASLSVNVGADRRMVKRISFFFLLDQRIVPLLRVVKNLLETPRIAVK